MEFKDKHVFISGGASGIGFAIGRNFVGRGALVTLADIDQAAAEAAAAELRGAGDAAEASHIDVSDAQSVAESVGAAAARMGALDIMVSNAGIGFGKSFLGTTPEDFAKVIAVNLAGVFHTSRAGADEMIARNTQSGRLINMASVSGVRGSANRAAYGAAKAGVINLTQVAAVELAKHGITANAIAPGPIETPLVQNLHTDETRASWIQGTPAQKYGVPEDIAAAAVYLAGDGAGHVTGTILTVDGGWAGAGLMY